VFLWYNIDRGGEMDKYHVHVYIVQALAEVNVDACDPVEAKEKALAMSLNYVASDCHKIAIAFREEDD